MRRLWLLLTAAAIGGGSGIGAIGCGSGMAAGAPGLKPVATVSQIMDAIVIPSSQALFDAVVYDNGALVQAPASDDDWFHLQMQALAVAEAGNLLQLPPRAKDDGDWAAMSLALTDAAAAVGQAAEAQDIEELLRTGGVMYTACAACHRKYVPEMGS
jgi:hypothetical protein